MLCITFCTQQFAPNSPLMFGLIQFLFDNKKTEDVTAWLSGGVGAGASVINGHPLLLFTDIGSGVVWGDVATFTVNTMIGGAFTLLFKIAYDVIKDWRESDDEDEEEEEGKEAQSE